MATFSRLEEIQVWQKARHLTKQIYEATSNGRFAQDYGLRNQIQRASISIMANIAEGFGRRSDKEFANFLNMARLSDRSSVASLRCVGSVLHQQVNV